MKVTIDHDALADAVGWLARTLPQRTVTPMLAAVRVEASQSQLTMSGFDYVVSTRVSAEAEVAERGQLLLPGRLFADVVRSLPPQPVRLSTEGPRVNVECGSAQFTLATLPLDDFPALPELPQAAGTVGSDVFASAVASVAVAAGRDDDVLPVFSGIRMEIEGSTITLAATDRYRLAVRELTWSPSDPGFRSSALVPARTLNEAAKALAAGATVSIGLAAQGSGDGLFGLAGSGRQLTTRQLEGEYPNYRSLFPAQVSGVVTVTTAALIEAVKRVSLVASRTSPVQLTLNADAGTLQAGGLEDAEARETLPLSYSGEQMTIAFNPDYLLAGLAALDSDEARIAVTTPMKPAVITGKPEGATDYRYLLMPVRLPN
ncbi:MAG: DNA polymerase III subunit beta [Mycobacteriales bacterium]